MGVSLNPLHFLAHTRGPLGRTLTLGHQDNNLPRDQALIQKIFQEAGRDVDADRLLHEKYADAILLALGATEVVSMDASGYENADIIHDLNKPIPAELEGAFDTVIDGGTLEHVFHLPNALTNVARMVKVGGRFLGISPANNWLGHGLYQFSPELMWRFCKGFGFSVNRIDLYVRGSYPKANPIPDPEEAGQRITINTPPQYVDLMTDAIKRKNLYPEYLYQSDYVAHWSAKGQGG